MHPGSRSRGRLAADCGKKSRPLRRSARLGTGGFQLGYPEFVADHRDLSGQDIPEKSMSVIDLRQPSVALALSGIEARIAKTASRISHSAIESSPVLISKRKLRPLQILTGEKSLVFWKEDSVGKDIFEWRILLG
jgi:hypothetical protein